MVIIDISKLKCHAINTQNCCKLSSPQKRDYYIIAYLETYWMIKGSEIMLDSLVD